MSRSRVPKIAISSCLFCCCIAQARAADSLAQTLLGDFTGTKLSMIDVAVRLSLSRIPIGVEAVNAPEAAPLDLALKDASVADVLNAATRDDPRYEWKESNGVINLLPKGQTGSVFSVTVNHFEATNDEAIQFVQQLLDTPNVKTTWLIRT